MKENQESPSRKPARLTVNLPETELEGAKYLAQEQFRTVSDVVRSALRREAVLFEAAKEGAEVVVRYPEEDKPDAVFMDLEFIRKFGSE